MPKHEGALAHDTLTSYTSGSIFHLSWTSSGRDVRSSAASFGGLPRAVVPRRFDAKFVIMADKSKSDLLQGTLDMLILQVVALGPLHGYAVGQRLQQITRDALQVQQGSLYPALHRLEERGWLRAEWRASETGRDAKFYSLTGSGRKQLAVERLNWERLAGAIALVLRTAE